MQLGRRRRLDNPDFCGVRESHIISRYHFSDHLNYSVHTLYSTMKSCFLGSTHFETISINSAIQPMKCDSVTGMYVVPRRDSADIMIFSMQVVFKLINLPLPT